jgi:3-hydroxyacyl-CoA dehydrogenase
MGGGIAMSFAEFGFPVKILEASQEPLDRGLGRIRANYETSVKRSSLSEAEMKRRLALIKPVRRYDDIGQCDVVIEAVFERIPVKEEVFKKLDEVMKPGALLFSNTSGIDIDIMANVTKRPQDVAGTHFFAQPQPHPVRHRDDHHGQGRGTARAGRQGNGRFRLSDRPVCNGRSARARHRL